MRWPYCDGPHSLAPLFMNIPASFFGSLSTSQFLAEYWQKKPLLVRGAWPNFESPLSPAEFLKLSARDDAFSRLLVKLEGEHEWDVREGPFKQATFDAMPESQWTLLIQEVDRLVPAVRDMLRVVSFLPKWRLDDIMISYAANGGGVGAHIDNYDVFLLQGHGRRRWQINSTPVLEEELIEGIDVSILAHFEPDHDWVLEPGDMLYLPPRVAHHGVALGPCMTFSFGCRAPSALDMMTGVLEHVLGSLDSNERLQDPGLKPSDHPAKLDGSATKWVQSLLRRLADDETTLNELVGMMLSEPRRLVEDGPDSMLGFDELLAARSALRPAASSQVLYSVHGRELTLFAGGEVIPLSLSDLTVVEQLVSPEGLRCDAIGPDSLLRDLWEELFENGTLVFH